MVLEVSDTLYHVILKNHTKQQDALRTELLISRHSWLFGKNIYSEKEIMNCITVTILRGFPDGSDGKASACNVGDPGSIPGSGRSPWRRKWQSTPALLPGESHGWRSLISYSPWGHKESRPQRDTTVQLHFHHSKVC